MNTHLINASVRAGICKSHFKGTCVITSCWHGVARLRLNISESGRDAQCEGFGSDRTRAPFE